jgi:hypothetical protein
MANYRKKPVVVQAEQWFPGKHIVGVAERGDPGFPEHYTDEHGRRKKIPPQYGWIGTLEGGHLVSPGDWIITGVQGEKYACKPDVFAMTYEPAEADPS